MEKIKLNKNSGKLVFSDTSFKLNPKIEYVINLKDEIQEVGAQMAAVQAMGLAAMNDYYDWLESNGFSSYMPDPTNEFVEKYYGVKPLWSTKLSQGIVVKDEEDDDFYIVMECSRENPGFKYAQMILTPGGCM